MGKILVLAIFIMFSCLSFAVADCLQEFANESTPCGGVASSPGYILTGTWTNGANGYDGDNTTFSYATSGVALLFVNYTKPVGFSSATWEVIDYEGFSITWTNLSIPSGCAALDPIQVRVNSSASAPTGADWYCYNSSSAWQLLRHVDTYRRVYEEKMWWEIGSETLTQNSFSIDPSSMYTSGSGLFNCSTNYSSNNLSFFTAMMGLAINGSIEDSFNITNTTYQNNTEWKEEFDASSYLTVGTNISCWSLANTSTMNASVNYTQNVTISNPPGPDLNSLSIAPASLYNDSTAYCTSNYSDNDSSVFTVMMGLSVNGSVIDSHNTTNSSYSNNTAWQESFSLSAYSIGDNISCWSFANDSYTETSINYTDNITIEARPPPIQRELSISSTIKYYGNFTCSINYSDADNSTFYAYAGVAVNGVINGSYNLTNSTFSNNTAWGFTNDTAWNTGTNLSCWAYAYDGITYTSVNYSVNSTVINDTPEIQFINISPSSIYVNENVTCTFNATDNDSSTFILKGGLTINGVIDDTYNMTNSSYSNSTLWTFEKNTTGNGGGTKIACWVLADDAYSESQINYSSNVSITSTTTDPDRWFPNEFEASNIRLNATYPKKNYTYICYADAFTLGETTVSAATFEIEGCGINITSSDSESIGTQSPTDKMRWQSTEFTPNTTGTLTCSIIFVDEYGSTETDEKTFYVSNTLGTCGDNDNCEYGDNFEVNNEIIYYRNIILNSSAYINSGSGKGITFWADENVTLAGKISLNGTSGGGVEGYAGYLVIYSNQMFNQTGNIVGFGTDGGNNQKGGSGLDIYVEADLWEQSGAIQVEGGNAGSCTGDGNYGRDGSDHSGQVTFKGREWRSTGAWTMSAGDAADGCNGVGADVDGGDGGSCFEVDGFYVYGFLNKTAGNVAITACAPGDGGDATNGNAYGGSGGHDFAGFEALYVSGRAYVEGITITLNLPYGGTGGNGIGTGDGGDGSNRGTFTFLQADTTDFHWNITAINKAAPNGGNGGSGGIGGAAGDGGDGGDWRDRGNTTYEGIKCRDTCNIITQIQLTGGTGGGGGAGGSNGNDASWEAQYNQVAATNDFTNLDPARTTYNLSSDSTFIRNATLSDTLTVSNNKTSVFSLEYINITWSSTNNENRTLYYEFRIYNPAEQKMEYPFQCKGIEPTPLRTNMSENYYLDTNRYNVTTYVIEVRERSDYYRFTDWENISVSVVHANSSVSALTNGIDAVGEIEFVCNYTGYDFDWDGTTYDEDLTDVRAIFNGFIQVKAENNGANNTYNATYDEDLDIYSASTSDTFVEGNHSWWCLASKANYQDALAQGTDFEVGRYQVYLPTGITSVDIYCIFPTISGMEPIGQDGSTPIFTLVNNNDSDHNYSLRISQDPTGGSIYFSLNNSRTTEYQLNSTSNKTVCENVPYANTTACRVWLWADCVNATVVSGLNVSYIFGEQS